MIGAGDMLAEFRGAPVRDIRTITGDAPILVLAPHPDDESLGFGGLIAAAAARQTRVHVTVLTDGTGSHRASVRYPPSRLQCLRAAETRAAVAELGVGAENVGFLDAPDGGAPTGGPAFAQLAGRLCDIIRREQVGLLLTTWRHDPHCDHQAAAVLGEAVARATGVTLLMAPVWGWTLADDHPLPGPIPSALRLDITAHLPAKRRAIAAHVSQTTALIDDCPDGFRLPPDFLALFDRPWEVFVTA